MELFLEFFLQKFVDWAVFNYFFCRNLLMDLCNGWRTKPHLLWRVASLWSQGGGGISFYDLDAPKLFCVKKYSMLAITFIPNCSNLYCLSKKSDHSEWPCKTMLRWQIINSLDLQFINSLDLKFINSLNLQFSNSFNLQFTNSLHLQ